MELPTHMIEGKYWRTLFNAIPIPTVLLKADYPTYTIAFANEAYLKISNSRREIITGSSFVDLLNLHYRNVDEILATLKLLLHNKLEQKQSAVRYESHIPNSNDIAIKYFDISNTPLLGSNGEIEFIIRTINDVTKLIETQKSEKITYENLIKHEKFLRESQRVALIGNWEVDMVNNNITWSEVLKEIYEVHLDYQPTFEDGLGFYKDDKYKDVLLRAINEATEENSVFDIDSEIVTAAGNTRWVRNTGKADIKDGKCIRLYGVTQDITTSKTIEKALKESVNQYQALIESVEGVVWEADANTFEFTYISNKINDLLGYTPEQWLSETNFWANHIYQDDREWAVTFCQNQTKEVLNHVFDYRMIKADGGIVWVKDLVSVISENGIPKILRGVLIDISASKLLSSLDNLEKSVLELVADKREDISHILSIYLKGIENLLPNMKCSLLQIKNNRAYTLAAPSLPKDYMNAINGESIGEKKGSCGTAAYRKEKVIVTDISTDPLWEDYKHLALKHNLMACWSYPVINSDNEAIAVFGLYYNDIKKPGDTENLVIERSAAILKVILENRQRAKLIEETSMLIAQGQELANFGNWQWDIKNNTVKWSDVLYNIYGVDKENHIATYEGYLAMLHADDREAVQNIILGAVHTKEDIVFEERIIRPDGETRYLKSWGRVICDSDGNPEKMIGSCLDITSAKIVETKLWDIAWMQSHLVRAPLVRLMGLVDVLKEEQISNCTDEKLFSYIMITAHELDQVIKDISNKTLTKV